MGRRNQRRLLALGDFVKAVAEEEGEKSGEIPENLRPFLGFFDEKENQIMSMSKPILIGSSMLGLANAHDRDWLILDDEVPLDRRNPNLHKHVGSDDFTHVNPIMLRKALDFELPMLQYGLFMLFDYQKDRKLIGSDFPYDYDWLSHRAQIIELVQTNLDNNTEGCGLFVCRTNGVVCMEKNTYHVAWNIFALMDGDVRISPEHLAIVQKIHDREMPQTYIEELRKMAKDLR